MYCLSSAGCLYLGMYVIAIVATPLTYSFETLAQHTSWDCLKMFSQIFEKMFFAELLPFFYISLRFLCKFEE